ncbi:carbohydrate ABC transporter substrate-binding protein, CUT1 family [Pseudonocardia thermophila]|jgi:ABC-type sugar transport system, periplasmic component|uniref:Carbohydrate ABC transporter substrate-binding protein, CUT1 family n=1 Tax=Pseudonocardia thermophila TaxID=1848 RepID=A0A1M6Z6C1_PSETH|nr:ABC transporter substrate-binding protein [Pseudonocardia thermophila]SHL25975.1 carbohydrate ABC transporter substrate-binding protein, CUT1 family [Pseudonocardia thermophila]
MTGSIRMPELDRRGFLRLTGMAGAAAAVAACGGPTVTAPGSGPAAVEQVDFTGVTPAKTITFWSNNPGSSGPVTQQIIDAYEAANPGMKVNLVNAGQNYEEIAQKFQTAQTGGQVPDLVVLSDVWWFRYYMQRSIIPLDSVIEAVGIDLSDYREVLVKDYQYNGAQWAIPWARSTPLFYYNKNHWQAAGLPDRAPTTWQEFAEWAPRLQAADTGAQHAFQMPALADYAGWTFQNNLWGEGGGWSRDFEVICDSPESVSALEFLKQAAAPGGWAGVSAKDQANDLSAGAVSATVSSTGSLAGVLRTAQFPVGVGFLPGGSKVDKPVCPTGGAGLGIPKNIPKENQLAAAQFIKFLTSPENCILFSQETGYLPIRNSANIDELVTKTPQAKVAIDQLAVTRPQDNARVFFPGGDGEMAKAAAKILNEQADVTETMQALKATLNNIYETQVKPNL